MTGKPGRQREGTAVILAGGGSLRMGTAKSLIDVGGHPLIALQIEMLRDRFFDILISANDPTPFAFTGLTVIPDRDPGTGPLMGICSALSAARYEPVLVMACDIPEIDPSFLGRLLAGIGGHDVAMPRHADGMLEPLLAVWQRSALPAIDAALLAGERRITAVLPHLRVRWVSLGKAPWLANLNTADDVAAWLRNRSASHPATGRREH